MQPQEATALLDWYIAMGVDETLGETPHDWRKPAMVTPQPVVAMVETAPPSKSAPLAAAPINTDVAELVHSVTTLAELEEAVRDFKGLSICNSATQPVFAEGNPEAPLMVIGEAPGAEEDRRGIPFCGPSGKLLDKMLAAIGHTREKNAYITNSLFWRPPGNRTPNPEELAACRPFVEKHIELHKPKVILLAGGVAVRSLLQQETAISRLRGKVQDYQGIPVLVTYHPSYLLRQPNQKKLAWQDMLALKGLTEKFGQ